MAYLKIMVKNILYKLAFILSAAVILLQNAEAKASTKYISYLNPPLQIRPVTVKDTTPPADVMLVVKTAIYALNNFNIESVADLYTPNAVIADDEPPYSWNGPTAGVQWVNAVQKVCKDNKLTKLKGTIQAVSVYQHSAENVYMIVPVTYTGDLPGRESFTAEGGFTFVLRLVNGKWMIKSQVWMPRKGME